MDGDAARRRREEVWTIKGRRYRARIYSEAEWERLPAEQRPATAMLVRDKGWVDLGPANGQAGVDEPTTRVAAAARGDAGGEPAKAETPTSTEVEPQKYVGCRSD
jgi:hypothetical protein